MPREVPQVLVDSAETFERKGNDYGDTWRHVGEVLDLFADDNEVVIDSPEAASSYFLFCQRIVNIERAFRGEFIVDEMNYESTADSHTDEVVYAAMHASLHEEQSTDAGQGSGRVLGRAAERILGAFRDALRGR